MCFEGTSTSARALGTEALNMCFEGTNTSARALGTEALNASCYDTTVLLGRSLSARELHLHGTRDLNHSHLSDFPPRGRTAEGQRPGPNRFGKFDRVLPKLKKKLIRIWATR